MGHTMSLVKLYGMCLAYLMVTLPHMDYQEPTQEKNLGINQQSMALFRIWD